MEATVFQPAQLLVIVRHVHFLIFIVILLHRRILLFALLFSRPLDTQWTFGTFLSSYPVHSLEASWFWC